MNIRRFLVTPRRQQQGVAALTVMALVVPIGWAFLHGSGSPTSQLALSSGQAWLPSPAHGLLTLVDGPSNQVVMIVPTQVAAQGLSVTQLGQSALVADDHTGSVVRVDGATGTPSNRYRFAAPQSDLSILSSPDAAFVVDATSRQATVIDPVSLVIRRRITMAARPGPHQSLIDAAGRLWAVDADGSGLNWYQPDGSHGQLPAGRTAQLIDVDGRPAIVDVGVAQPTISWLGKDSIGDSWNCRLATRVGDDLQLLGSSSSNQMFAAVSQSGTLITTSATGGACDPAVGVGAPGARFGGLVQSGSFVFVPNLTDGSTYVIDANRPDSVLTSLPLATPGHHVQLVARDGLVFYNDLDSEVAGVLSFRGGTWRKGKAIEKYNPADPVAEVTPTDTTLIQPNGSAPPSSTSSRDSASTASGATHPTTVLTQPPSSSLSTIPTQLSSSLVDTTTGTPTPAGFATTTQSPTSALPTTPVLPGPGTSTAHSTQTPTSTSTSTSTSTTITPAKKKPVIDALTVTPASIGIEQQTTLRAHITPAAGAQWTATVTAASCAYRYTSPITALTLDQQDSGDLSAPVGPLPWGCLGAYVVTLSVKNAVGAAVDAHADLTVTSDPSTTPAISTMSCSPVNPGLGEPVTCTAAESVVGSRGTWTWSVTDADNSVTVLAPVAQSANLAFTPQLSRVGHYTVTLTVNYRGATDSATADLRSAVTVPNELGQQAGPGTDALRAAGLIPAALYTPSHQPPDSIVQQTPSGSPALFGDTVTLTISSGPNQPFHLLDSAPAAHWTSGAGDLAWQGSDGDNRGFARRWAAGEKPLEDNSAQECLETHPQWVDNGEITGTFTLAQPIIAGDHFKALIGFRAPDIVGNVVFAMGLIRSDGTTQELLVQQKAVTGTLLQVDVDLSDGAGATGLYIRVSANGSSTQDWAIWVDPRVE